MKHSAPRHIFDFSSSPQHYVSAAGTDIDGVIPASLLRTKDPGLPCISEPECIRHYAALARRNFGVDNGFYPLGSCTMKYNPRIDEELAALPGFAEVHPYTDAADDVVQLLRDCETALCAISGMSRITFQPAAGAHGETTGLLLVRAYHADAGDSGSRTEILVPDSAHGTNPATAAMAGFTVVQVKSDDNGNVDIHDLRSKVSNKTAAIMLTNPNTLGLFEEHITRIADIVHTAGGLLYYDGANLNALLGVCRPGDIGFDIMHFNLHKTFATPHGGGGPGAGPVGVAERLVPFLPGPMPIKNGNGFYTPEKSIGRVRAFYGNIPVIIKAYVYIKSLGSAGLRHVAHMAVLNANYLLEKLTPLFDRPYARRCLHEFVLSADRYAQYSIRAMDIAKRLIDYGFHPPTMYFPLIVSECLMIEPTETESKETLDAFISAVAAVIDEIKTDAETVRTAPHLSPVARLDETYAARNPDLTYNQE